MKTCIVVGGALQCGIWFGFIKTTMELGKPPSENQVAEGATDQQEEKADPNPVQKKTVPSKLPLVPEGQPQPKVVVEKSTTFNFGNVDAGTKGSHKFIVRNEGKGALQLAKGRSSCACTIGRLSPSDCFHSTK